MHLINITNVKKEAIETSKRLKGGKYTMVSKEFLNEVEEDVRLLVYKKVMAHPSKGKTLRALRG